MTLSPIHSLPSLPSKEVTDFIMHCVTCLYYFPFSLSTVPKVNGKIFVRVICRVLCVVSLPNLFLIVFLNCYSSLKKVKS